MLAPPWGQACRSLYRNGSPVRCQQSSQDHTQHKPVIEEATSSITRRVSEGERRKIHDEQVESTDAGWRVAQTPLWTPALRRNKGAEEVVEEKWVVAALTQATHVRVSKKTS
jgi:hypothetical protein